MQAPGFWDDQNQARLKSEQYNNIKNEFDFWTGLQKELEDLFSLVTQQIRTEPSDEDRQYLESQY